MHFTDHFIALQLALNERQVKLQLGSNHAFYYTDKDGERRCDMGTTCILPHASWHASCGSGFLCMHYPLVDRSSVGIHADASAEHVSCSCYRRSFPDCLIIFYDASALILDPKGWSTAFYATCSNANIAKCEVRQCCSPTPRG